MDPNRTKLLGNTSGGSRQVNVEFFDPQGTRIANANYSTPYDSVPIDSLANLRVEMYGDMWGFVGSPTIPMPEMLVNG